MELMREGDEWYFICYSCSTRITPLTALRALPCCSFGTIRYATFDYVFNVETREGSGMRILGELMTAQECVTCHQCVGFRYGQSGDGSREPDDDSDHNSADSSDFSSDFYGYLLRRDEN